jgi:cyclopropane fatty-acyl-phospholipid synthase-like methyltransferase
VDGLPFSQAAENNAAPIGAQLERLLAGATQVLELGAGTGQHAVAFAARFPHLLWQPTEHPDALPMLQPRCAAAGLRNLLPPVALDICDLPWSVPAADALYTANTLHIVSPAAVEALFRACEQWAAPGSLLLVYGPFNYRGAYTAHSNARFDAWLRERDPRSGIRDVEWVEGLARAAGYAQLEDIAMPANNRLLCWQRTAVSSSA